MQWWQFRSTRMRSVILAKVSVLKIAWEARRFARGDGNAIARRQRARLHGLASYAPRLSTAMAARYAVMRSAISAGRTTRWGGRWPDRWPGRQGSRRPPERI